MDIAALQPELPEPVAIPVEPLQVLWAGIALSFERANERLDVGPVLDR